MSAKTAKKIEKNQKIRDENEVKGCTFRPKLENQRIHSLASTQRTFSLESSYSDLYLRKKAHKHKLFVSKSNKNLYLNTKNLNENPVKENISSFNNTERLHYSKILHTIFYNKAKNTFFENAT